MSHLRVLHLEDDASDAALVAETLRHDGIDCLVTVVATRPDFIAALEQGQVELVLADYSLPGFDGLSALQLARSHSPELPYILLSGSLGEELAVDALKSGATDFVLKGRLSRLAPAIRRAVQEVRERAARHVAEKALRESEARLQTIVDSLPAGLVVSDLSGKLLHFNRAAVALHGLSDIDDWRRCATGVSNLVELSTLAGKVVPVEEWPLAQILGGVPSLNLELEVRRHGIGWRRVLNYGGCVLRDTDGRPAMAMITVTDITGHKEAERLLRQNEANFHRTMEHHVDGLIVTNMNGDVMFVNSAATAMWPVADAPRPGRHFDVAVAAGDEREFELEGARGHSTIVNMRVGAIEWQGHPAYLVSLRDVTVHKQNERNLQQASEELRCANQSLVERNTEIQNFYHTLSHELKTPLTAAREFVSIVVDGIAGPLNTAQLEFLGISIESCDQMALYVNDLLDVTRLETGKLSLEKQTVQLDALVERAVEMLRPTAAGKELALTYECEADLPPTSLDQHRILQVLTNLTTNAIKFTEPGGRIHLSLTQSKSDPPELQVSVEDTGRGIPEADLEPIFSRLYQASRDHMSSDSRSGLGLGLYICQELVHLHGGRLWVDSEVGKGSIFTFTVPSTQPLTEPDTLEV